MLKYSKNVKKITYYNPTDNQLVGYPLFKIEKLLEKEVEILKFIKINKNFLQKDLAFKIEISTAHVSRILEKLQEENYVIKKSNR